MLHLIVTCKCVTIVNYSLSRKGSVVYVAKGILNFGTMQVVEKSFKDLAYIRVNGEQFIVYTESRRDLDLLMVRYNYTNLDLKTYGNCYLGYFISTIESLTSHPLFLNTYSDSVTRNMY